VVNFNYLEPFGIELWLTSRYIIHVDQRRSLRILVDLPARFRSKTLSVDGRAVNLSQRGVLIRCHPSPRLPAGETMQVALEIDLPDTGAPIAATGEVCWTDRHEKTGALGIRFIALAITARRRLANVILRACAAL
jgi:hypothetical protein